MASTRFPGKPLASILGKPMIQLVYERAARVPGSSGTIVATDSPEIASAVRGFGGEAVMTGPDHPSGTDRLAEAAEILGLSADTIVLNVQGDQPALNPRHPAMLAQALEDDPSCPVSTLAVPFADRSEIADPNHVKAVLGQDGRALYFSRAPIPYLREGGSLSLYRKHAGLYAYRASFLSKFALMPRGLLEEAEKLEQLRILEHGYPIKVVLAQGLSPEVDVPGDILKAAQAIESGA
jgi:3-deoxy-manno-octulosonate cytidylyltransferase (CMP-KDO synthetase)